MYQQHPLSAAFHAMSDEDFQSLKDSITNIGVQNPITVFEGMVIDGWHRYIAANEMGMDCPVVALGDVDPRDFVLAQNKARRHITQAQLAMATTSVYAWRPVGNPALSNSAPGAELKTTKELAVSAGVSERTIEQAKAVQTKAAPEVVEAVKAGEIGLKKAAAIAKLPKEEQAAAIAKPIHKKEAPEPQQQEEDEYTELDALADQVRDLQAEVARLKLLVPAEADEGNDMLKEMQHEMATLRQANKAITIARDRFQAENAELKRQCVWLKKQLDKQK